MLVPPAGWCILRAGPVYGHPVDGDMDPTARSLATSPAVEL